LSFEALVRAIFWERVLRVFSKEAVEEGSVLVKGQKEGMVAGGNVKRYRVWLMVLFVGPLIVFRETI